MKPRRWDTAGTHGFPGNETQVTETPSLQPGTTSLGGTFSLGGCHPTPLPGTYGEQTARPPRGSSTVHVLLRAHSASSDLVCIPASQSSACRASGRLGNQHRTRSLGTPDAGAQLQPSHRQHGVLPHLPSATQSSLVRRSMKMRGAILERLVKDRVRPLFLSKNTGLQVGQSLRRAGSAVIQAGG